MVSSQFGVILKELESFFNCQLEPDLNNSCLIKMGIGISIQFELDRFGLLLIGCRLGGLPMSRYRDNLIQQALKFNSAFLPSTGIFGFSQKSKQLLLFLRLDPVACSIHDIIALLTLFTVKAKKWSDAIENGEIPILEQQENHSNTPSGLFGLLS